MAASDYEVGTTGTMCPVGYLASDLNPGDTIISITGFSAVEGEEADLVLGMGLMINGEIMRLDSKVLPDLTVARGCADTIPRPTAHPVGSTVWFFSRDLASDNREYAATEVVGVKLLPFTGSGGSVPVEYAPPHELVFNWRHIRPYPPGDFKCKGEAWYSSVKLMAFDQNELIFTWAHRDRLTQADQLVGHLESSVGPEVGTTYVARVYDSFGVQVREETGITGTTWSYTRLMAVSDSMEDKSGYIDIYSERDGFESWQGYRTQIFVSGASTRITENNEVRMTESSELRTQE